MGLICVQFSHIGQQTDPRMDEQGTTVKSTHREIKKVTV